MAPVDVLLLVLLSAIWGASFMFMRFLAPILGPLATADLRILVAGIALVAFLAVAGFRLKWGERWRRYLVVGLLNSAIPFSLYSFAALSLSASVEAVLNALSPCFGAIFAAIWLGEPLDWRKLLGMALGLVGVVIVSGIGRPGAANGSLPAVLACVAATACYGLAGIYLKKKAKDIEPKAMAAGSQFLGGIFLLPSLAVFPPSALLRPRVAGITLLFALMCSAVAYLIYYRLMAKAGPTKALTVTFLIPVFSFLWAGLILGERVNAVMLGGSILILGGTYLVVAGKRPVSRPEPAIEGAGPRNSN
jgi:drug/metabolite transporter (DMT)-like permease